MILNKTVLKKSLEKSNRLQLTTESQRKINKKEMSKVELLRYRVKGLHRVNGQLEEHKSQ